MYFIKTALLGITTILLTACGASTEETTADTQEEAPRIITPETYNVSLEIMTGAQAASVSASPADIVAVELTYKLAGDSADSQIDCPATEAYTFTCSLTLTSGEYAFTGSAYDASDKLIFAGETTLSIGGLSGNFEATLYLAAVTNSSTHEYGISFVSSQSPLILGETAQVTVQVISEASGNSFEVSIESDDLLISEPSVNVVTDSDGVGYAEFMVANQDAEPGQYVLLVTATPSNFDSQVASISTTFTLEVVEPETYDIGFNIAFSPYITDVALVFDTASKTLTPSFGIAGGTAPYRTSLTTDNGDIEGNSIINIDINKALTIGVDIEDSAGQISHIDQVIPAGFLPYIATTVTSDSGNSETQPSPSDGDLEVAR